MVFEGDHDHSVLVVLIPSGNKCNDTQCFLLQEVLETTNHFTHVYSRWADGLEHGNYPLPNQQLGLRRLGDNY